MMIAVNVIWQWLDGAINFKKENLLKIWPVEALVGVAP